MHHARLHEVLGTEPRASLQTLHQLSPEGLFVQIEQNVTPLSALGHSLI